jgi:hypothetical protein
MRVREEFRHTAPAVPRENGQWKIVGFTYGSPLIEEAVRSSLKKAE